MEEDDEELEGGDEALAAGLQALLGGAEAVLTGQAGPACTEDAALRASILKDCGDEEDLDDDAKDGLEDAAEVEVEEYEECQEEDLEEESAEEFDEENPSPKGSEDADAADMEAAENGDDEDADDLFMVDVDGSAEAAAPAGATATAMGAGGEDIEELIAVPRLVAEHLLGGNGEAIRKLSANCGDVKLMFLGAASSYGKGRGRGQGGEGSRMLSAKGLSSAVSMVKRTVRNLAEELEKEQEAQKTGPQRRQPAKQLEPGAGAGGSTGVCKWYAAGFCRNRIPLGEVCRNGRHDGAAALAAETCWVEDNSAADFCRSASAPSCATRTKASRRPGRLPLLLLLDLEGGGNQAGRDGEDEIIEVPVLAMCPVTGDELGRFHRFARPSFWDLYKEDMQRRHPADCFNRSSSAVPFPQVMLEMKAWIDELLSGCLKDDGGAERPLRKEDFLFVTCGNWDVKTIMPKQCGKPVAGAVSSEMQALMLSRWSNLKEVFREHFGLAEAAAPTGMRGMLKRLKIPLSGQHHLGMDDVTNLSKILRTLVLKGARIEATGHATEAAAFRRKRPVAAAGPAAAAESHQQDPVGGMRHQRPASAGYAASPPPASTERLQETHLDPADEEEDEATVASAPAAPRTGKGILAKYSNSARAYELGQEVRIKKRPPGEKSPPRRGRPRIETVASWAPSSTAAAAQSEGSGGMLPAPGLQHMGRWQRNSPSLLSSGKAAGKRR
eukprot:TRINITY_DN35661_c0_g1_i1.p1 TRINITY_DN35661_c0_g1~~TRINITY_DN35661_c0_g1_i1.p1  ORF type:complete len:725 (-),score=201.78 TRINITY_DN35661_c0_g1_i1:188-2362(-)